jgi:hypothetical protein
MSLPVLFLFVRAGTVLKDELSGADVAFVELIGERAGRCLVFAVDERSGGKSFHGLRARRARGEPQQRAPRCSGHPRCVRRSATCPQPGMYYVRGPYEGARS